MDIIKDDMVKESKAWKNPMIIFFVLAVLFPLVLIWNDITIDEFVFGEIFFILICCYFLYGYVYTQKYKVVVTNEKIVLKTLFKSVEVQFKDIKTYNCKRYGKSEFYQFYLFIKDRKVLVNTRYKDEFKKVLKDNKIKQIIK